jgi:hypothetical protein
MALMFYMATALMADLANKVPAERLRAFGVVAVILSYLSVGAALSFGRGGWFSLLEQSRYTVLASPALCATFVAFVLSRSKPGWVFQLLFVSIALYSYPTSFRQGEFLSATVKEARLPIEVMLKNGASISEIEAKYGDRLLGLRPKHELVPCLEMLRDAGIGDFPLMAPESRKSPSGGL